MKKIIFFIGILIILSFLFSSLALAKDSNSDSGGGGSGGATCIANWLSGDWSECIDGLQTREYYDGNSCGYSYGKPELQTRSCEDGEEIEDEGGEAAIEIPESELQHVDPKEICGGCLLNDNCVTFGYRNNGKYCDLAKEFVEQKGNYEECENNFECKSNLCIDNECIEEGFFSKIISWFKRIFGRR